MIATDISPDAREKLEAAIKAAWPALESAGVAPGASSSRVEFTSDLDAAVRDCDLVQENGPERIDFKRELYRHLDQILPPETIIASSSSGLTMSAIQEACERHPERCVIGHPFNPPHIIPLVEVVGGRKTSEETISRVTAFYDGLGKRTIRLHKEVPGHVANRLQAALYREIVHLVSEGVVSVGDADAAVSWGPGLRWGIMGPNLLYHLGGGEGGIEHFFDQFTGPLNAWFSALGTESITAESRKKIIAGVKDELAGRGSAELSAERDALLLGLLKLRESATQR